MKTLVCVGGGALEMILLFDLFWMMFTWVGANVKMH
jgi:hypothetical protein